MKALIVDDSRSMRAIVARFLRDIGIVDVMQAGDGQEAIEILEGSDPPDIVLVDWHMPVMDGLEFVANVRRQERWRNMSIMMVTTESEQDQIVRALAAGAHEYLMKPFSHEALTEKLMLLGVICPTTAAVVGS